MDLGAPVKSVTEAAESADWTSRQLLVVSGGEGYIDFRIGVLS